MARPEMLGVSSAIKVSEVNDLTPAEQDDVIRREAVRLQENLAKFVGGLEPYKGRDLVFHVRGPFSDPIQGQIHVHTLAGWFDLSRLPADSPARAVQDGKAAGTTEGGTHLGGDLK